MIDSSAPIASRFACLVTRFGVTETEAMRLGKSAKLPEGSGAACSKILPYDGDKLAPIDCQIWGEGFGKLRSIVTDFEIIRSGSVQLSKLRSKHAAERELDRRSSCKFTQTFEFSPGLQAPAR